MAIQQKLHTKLVQKLILTPSLQQAIKLLPMSTLELSDLLNQEMVENPMLEEVPTEQLPDASVDDLSEQHADRALLMDIMKVLAPKQRSVVVLRHWEQMSTEETAAALGMSAGTVKSTLHRALARLREELESQGYEERAARELEPSKEQERCAA